MEPPSFSSLPLSPLLLTVIEELGFERLTEIQAQSIPLLLAGKDVVGQSKTGSGKTAAFALPILHTLRLSPRRLRALVLCPTRELCAQVAREIRKLGRRLEGLQVLVLAGGEPVSKQAFALERGVHVAVATPGRALDHLRRGNLDLRSVATVVLDEADRMLDMGFQEDMEIILGELPEARQTVFFSATFPPTIEAMSRAYQRAAVRITASTEESSDTQIRQLALRVEQDEKSRALRFVLAHHPHESALVFCNHKATVAELEKTLSSAGVSVACLHGDLEQYDRDRVMARFRNQSVRILIATDVAARGIDVENLDLVINYDLPPKPEVYVHRIGRTGRAGKAGLAISFTTSREGPKLKAIEQLTSVVLEPLSREEVELSDVAALSQSLKRDALMDTIQISGGRKEKVRPGDILGALTGEAGGFQGEDIGKIEIHDHFAYVAIAKHVSKEAVKSLNAGKIKGRSFRARLVE